MLSVRDQRFLQVHVVVIVAAEPLRIANALSNLLKSVVAGDGKQCSPVIGKIERVRKSLESVFVVI